MYLSRYEPGNSPFEHITHSSLLIAALGQGLGCIVDFSAVLLPECLPAAGIANATCVLPCHHRVDVHTQ